MKSDFDIKVEWFGKAASDKVLKAALKGLKHGGRAVAGESQKLAPELSGTLKRSICVTEGGTPDLEEVFETAKTKKPSLNGKQGDELAVYVSANTPYAHKQHEQNRNHAKFLERGLQSVSDRIPQLVEKELKKL